jgi:DNA-binding GntR family transcriptional regulator
VAHFRSSYLTYKDPLDIYREHQKIVDTFRKGDKEAAVKFYAKNIGDPIATAKSSAKKAAAKKRP